MYTAKVPLIKAFLAQTRNCKIYSEFACMWLNKAFSTVKRVTLHELIKDYICGRQSHVEIISSHISSALLPSKRRFAELPLKVGLIPTL